MKTLLWSLMLGIAAGPVQALRTPVAPSIAGEWDATMNTPGGARTFKIVFQVSGEVVTGTVKRTAGDVALTGTIKGNELKFSYTIDYNGTPLIISMTALVDGDTMKGTVDFGGAAQDDFSAKRAGT